MNRKLGWGLCAGVALCASWCLVPSVYSQDAKPAAEKPKPATVKVERGPIVIETTLKGTIEAGETTELFLDMKAWTGPFSVKTAVPHGTRVKMGDVVLELDATKLDQALRDLKLERELADVTLKLAKDELPILEKSLPLNMTTAERDKRIAEEDFLRYNEIERAHDIKSSEFAMKSQLNYLDYAREELKQLEKMYRDKDLTEETEEIILKRQRNQIEGIEFNIESQKLRQDRETNLDRPRKDQTMQTNLQKATLAWQKAQFSLPLELNQKRLALQKLEAERVKTEERFAHLEADRAAMVVRAPSDGIVYHGHADRGVWNSATVTPRLHRNGVLHPNEVYMTVVSTRPLLIRADAEEKELHSLKAGLTGHATPVGFPSLKLVARMKSVSLIPRAAGSFETQTALEVPENVDTLYPGMTASVKFVTYHNETALLVASTAIFQDEGSETIHVYLARDGKPVRTDVEVGKSSGGKTEILKGLKEGDEILAAKP